MRLLALVALFFAVAAPARAQLDPIHRELDAYALYQSDVSLLLDAPISSTVELDAALEHMARHDPTAISRGFIAYTALTAAQSPAFVHGVRARVTAASRAAVIRQLTRDITYARRRPPGHTEATQLILSAIAADTARMSRAADRLEALGRTADTSSWAGEDRGARHARLTSLRITEAVPPSALARLHIGPGAASPLTDPTAFGGPRFWDALGDRTEAPPPTRAARERYLGGLDRTRTLAGLIIVDALQSQSARAEALLTDSEAQYCLRLQQLQLRQCAASASAPNEDALCLARHGLAGPAACFAAPIQMQ